jgi:hypothetical protein
MTHRLKPKPKKLNKYKRREGKRLNFTSRLDEVKSHAFLDTEMEEGFINWNNDDSRTEGLDRRMKYDRLLEKKATLG